MPEIPVGYRNIEGSERRPARGARRVGPADPNEKFSFTIRVRRRPDAAPLPDQDYWAANPPGRRRFMTRDELLARAGAAQADLDTVTTFVRRHGFEVMEISAARRTARVSGTVAQATSAFAVDLGRYESPEESYRGREGSIYLPNDVADVVHGIFGLDNRRMARRQGVTAPPGAVGLTPIQVAALYKFPPLKAAGQTIGILEFGGGFAQGDLNLFCASVGVPGALTPTPTLVSVDGQSTTTYAGSASNPNLGNDGEVALDVQIVASVAQGANIVMFFAPGSSDGWIDAVTTAIYETPSPLTALSISWGHTEDNWTSSATMTISEAFQDAAALGLAVFAGSGDLGSNGGDNDGSAHVLYPSSDPWVTACGGTYIANVANISTPSTTTFKEGTWNDPYGATTGGMSVPAPGAVYPLPGAGFLSSLLTGTGFPVPPWQKNIKATLLNGGRTPLTGRGVPDIAGNASPYSGYTIFVYGQQLPQRGGTSAVAPLYASLIAILAAKVGWPLGYLNPLLYQIAAGTSGSSVFADIEDDGNNELLSVPSGTAVVPCPAYVSTKGWDACTGLGRINGAALLTALVLQEETRPFDADYPFSFGSGGEWLNYGVPTFEGGGQWIDPSQPPIIGSEKTGDSIVAGRVNVWNKGDCTHLEAISNNNAVLAADNAEDTGGGVGVYGRSRGNSWSIGVAGVSDTGCGLYGVAGQTVSPTGVGVAGRALGGIATEYLPLEQVVGVPVGVLGHSAHGPGVRGHGGVLLKQPQAGVTLTAAVAAPGGVFSSGRLNDREMGKGANVPLQTVGLDPLPQLRLVPSIGRKLPTIGEVGDLFLVAPALSDGVLRATLHVCTAVHSGGAPQWQQVLLGPSLPGGTIVS
jgi:Pro-kumamolisin, activation domain